MDVVKSGAVSVPVALPCCTKVPIEAAILCALMVRVAVANVLFAAAVAVVAGVVMAAPVMSEATTCTTRTTCLLKATVLVTHNLRETVPARCGHTTKGHAMAVLLAKASLAAETLVLASTHKH